ncbi:hypothetical protein LINGRAHAP2_LOCUS27778 [Linum grandiflorum]
MNDEKRGGYIREQNRKGGSVEEETPRRREQRLPEDDSWQMERISLWKDWSLSGLVYDVYTGKHCSLTNSEPSAVSQVTEKRKRGEVAFACWHVHDVAGMESGRKSSFDAANAAADRPFDYSI